MKIALFSPINPTPSGISDYTEELIPELIEFWSIDLYVEKGFDIKSAKIGNLVNIIEYDPKVFDPEKYNEIIYHMGNSFKAHKYIYEAILKFKGVIVLHDYLLQGFYTEKFFFDKKYDFFINLQEKYYGNKGKEIANNIVNKSPIPIWNTPNGINFPLNEEILSKAKSIIVHSQFIKDLIKKNWNKSISLIPHHGHNLKFFNKNKIRAKLNVKNDDILICSTGFINTNKRLKTVITALNELNIPNIVYLIQGKDGSNLLSDINKYKNIKIIRKDYVPLEELESYIFASDICINLRFPTMGESSGSLLRMMGYGKPILVTDFGSYSDFPDYSVFKIDPDIFESEMIKKAIIELIKNKDFRISLGREAQEYVKLECSIIKCASMYNTAIKELITQKTN